MRKKSLTDLIAEAAEAASRAPEHLQEIAFSKAFDALSGASEQGKGASIGTAARRVGKNAQGAQESLALDDLDRTKHPDITHDRNALVNAMSLLRAARDDLRIDGLSASDIASTLTGKFRCRIGRRAVASALNGAGSLVDRRTEGRKVIFRLMSPGEERLGRVLAGDEDSGTRKARTTRKRSTTAKKKSKATDAGGAKTKRAGGRKYGAATGVKRLLDNGYFQVPRTIGVIGKELKDNHGRIFKSNELSPVLVRQIRSGALVRKKNADKQYEYKQA